MSGGMAPRVGGSTAPSLSLVYRLIDVDGDRAVEDQLCEQVPVTPMYNVSVKLAALLT